MRSALRSRRTAVVGGVALVLAAAAVGAYAASGSSSPRYRTATVERTGVSRTLDETGTAAQVSSDEATFATAGTVASVAVRAGQTVSVGQTLASLDDTALVAALDRAKQTTAEATLTLTEAEDGTLTAGGGSGGGSRSAATGSTTAASGTATGSLLGVSTSGAVALTAAATVPGSGTPTGSPSGSGSGSAAGSAGLPQLARAIAADQHALDGDLAVATTLLARASAGCRATSQPAPTVTVTVTASPTAAPTASPTASAGTTTAPTVTGPSSSPTTGPTAAPTSSPTGGSGPDACVVAQTASLAGQRTVAADEDALARSETAYAAALRTAAASGSGPTTGTGSTNRSGSTGTAGSSSGSISSGSAATGISAADIAAYQAKVDAATTAQAVARQNLTMATLDSPLAGTVLSVDLTAGTSSNGGGITVATTGGMVYTTSLPVTDVADVAVGQRASVLPDGTSTARTGTVSAISAAPDSDGDYTVTVTPDGGTAGIRTGSTAALTIATGSTSGALTVPTSALTTLGGATVVRVLKGGTVTVVRVTVATRGAVRSAVTGDLAVGDAVVLADLSTAVPASNSDTTTTRTGLGGSGFGGAGLLAGGGGGGAAFTGGGPGGR